MRKLNLDLLKEGWLGIPQSAGNFYYPALISCLEGNEHKSGDILSVSGFKKEKLKLEWSTKLDSKTLSFWKNKQLATEYGAIGLAAFIIENFTDFEFLEITEIGEGADFFLSQKSEQITIPFQQNPAAKLEVSGIWEEKKGNTMNMRINLKKRQVEKGKFDLPIFIFVVEFKTLKAKFIQK